jgi:2-oxoisovalerate dehydrogenase E2 component (dihydrolipoyl transacylase)
MAELKEFKLPDVGEGLTEADIVAWHVKPGDQVEDGQIIVEIETAKAVVELPSPWDGTVTRLLAEEGQTVEVGVPIITVQVGAASNERADAPAPLPAAGSTAEEPGERHAVLVGYGVKTSPTTRRTRKVTAGRPETAEIPAAPAAVPGAGQAAGAQAGQGPRHRPGRAGRPRQRPGRLYHPG